MPARLCPFCGMATDVPHETQEACIAALITEIDRTKHVLESVTEPLPPPSTVNEDEPQVS